MSYIIPDVPAYGFNTFQLDPSNTKIGADGKAGAIGCGPTTAAMILETYTKRGAVGLIVNPLADARAMCDSNYMSIDKDGNGTALNFHFGIEKFAHDRGYGLDAVLHFEPTTFNPNDPAGSAYPYAHHIGFQVGTAVTGDADFWVTNGLSDAKYWTLDSAKFLSFIKKEIDAGKPVSVTVELYDLSTNTFSSHWMVGVGYDLTNNLWAGYNTWDAQIHWYSPSNGFAGNDMGIRFIRTFNFLGHLKPSPPTNLHVG